MEARPSPLDLVSTRDESARQSFAADLRRHVLTRLATGMKDRYHGSVEPAYQALTGQAPQDGPTVHGLMKKNRHFQFYSAIRVNAQDMVYGSVRPVVDRQKRSLSDQARSLRNDASTDGGLELDGSLEVPRSVSAIDVHRAPGGYVMEAGTDDVAAGALYDHATRVFAFNQFGEDMNDIGMTMSNYVRLRHPTFKPGSILDCGCAVGHNTLPWATTFPDAEVSGIDVAAPMLRYASARAKQLQVPVHFRQMNATAMQYAGESFDVVFSSMFLHELPLRDIRAYFREAFRVLKPGGLLINMELPPNSEMTAYNSFYLDWDSFYNNEPFYKTFRDQDYRALCAGGGFAEEDFFQVTLPRYTFVGEEEFRASLTGPTQFDSRTGRMDPKGTRWYAFGAWKQK